MLQFTYFTLFPDMFPGVLGYSLAGKQRGQLWDYSAVNIRNYGVGKHAQVDDTPYGGGAGMVLRADVLGAAIEAHHPKHATLIHLTPAGAPFTQATAATLAQKQAISFICGRFEGVDARVVEHYQPLELSLGDFVLFGGEVAALAMSEAILRLLPGMLGNPETLAEESFSCHAKENTLLLEYPHYTKPLNWNGYTVPKVLLSGNHAHIEQWRCEQAKRLTSERRPDICQP